MRSWVWFRPPQPPTTVEVSPRITKRVVLVQGVWTSKAKGASFCQVDKISPVVRSRPWSTSGSHECTGARPTFNARAKVTRAVGKGWAICRRSHCPVNHALVVLAKSSMAAPAA